MDHPTRIYSESGDELDPRELSRLLGDLRYDGLTEYLTELALRLHEDSVSDQGRGRARLAAALLEASEDVLRAAAKVGIAWKICRARMEET